MHLLPTQQDFWFLPLGGSGEIGMNLNLYGHNGKWLMVDMGINFHDKYGIDVLTPDPSFIEDHKEHLVGLVVTHAHEDHIGAIPHLWPYLECPIYATPFTAEIIKRKLSEKPWGREVPIHIIQLNQKFSLSPFDLEFVHLTHSTLEPNALCITTPLGTVVHSGDWKIDPNPMVGGLTSESRLQKIGDDGVMALICDSTNAFNDGASGSEEAVYHELLKVVEAEPKNRVVIGCFASNVARVYTACKIAEKVGRRVCLVGRSMINMVSAAKETGYLKDLPNMVDEQTAMDLPKDKVLFVMTGSQGEDRAALSRISFKKHPSIALDKGDLVVFSSRIIPGNEKSIGDLHNRLLKLGCRLVDASSHDIHVSGHPAKEELKQMYEWIRPQALIPTHGEYRHMKEQADWALKCGIKTVLIPENGSVINLTPGQVKLVDMVETGRLGVDGNGLVSMDSMVIRDRSRLGAHGALFATVFYSARGELTRPPIINIMGLIDDHDEISEIISEIEPIIKSQVRVGYGSKSDCHKAIESALRQYLRRTFEKRPLTCIHLVKEGN
ncbi:MAG: ribonuclease J [Alphaproteobacteria bacterium]|nr:ribonuclease J [Alphaproteobacteria bacterium]